MTDGLRRDLRRWEEELHRPETRRNPDRMGVLLHPAFEEFGRSGRRYTGTRRFASRRVAGMTRHRAADLKVGTTLTRAPR
jgi:hypothetical protein